MDPDSRKETTTATDEELLAVSAEQPAAFGAFYRRHVRAVLRDLEDRLAPRAELVADACAETFARALERASLFDPRRDAASAWLGTIGASVAADAIRRGAVEARARRRLGMPTRGAATATAAASASTTATDAFLDLLELDLVEAAERRRQARRAAVALGLRGRLRSPGRLAALVMA